MTQIAETDTLESEQDQETQKPLTIEEARANRKSAKAGEPEPEAPEVEEEEVESTEDSEAEEVEGEEEPNDVLSKLEEEFDLDDLTQEQLEAIGEKLKIGSNKAFAEKRLRIKELEAELELERAEKEEALKVAPISNTAFSNLSTIEDVDKQIEQSELNAEHWNDQLILKQDTQYDAVADRDVRGVSDENGKFYPADQVLAFVKGERAKVKDLIIRKKEIAENSTALSQVGTKVETLKAELGLEGEAADRYDALLKSPKFKLVKDLIPEYGLELVELLAKASLHDGKAKKKVMLKRKAPISTNGSIPSSPNGRGTPKKGRAAELSKIVNNGGYTPQQKLNAMRELRTLTLNK